MSHIHSSQIKLTRQILHLGEVKFVIHAAKSGVLTGNIIHSISLDQHAVVYAKEMFLQF